MSDPQPPAATSWRSLLPIVVEAGELGRSYAARRLSSETKTGLGDIVTEADLALDRFLSEALLARFPGIALVTEETADSVRPVPPGRLAAVVDPIDGTTNFAAGTPLWCISVGLVDADGQSIAGVIGAPALDRWYVADRGAGAFEVDRTGRILRPLSVRPQPLADSLFAVSLSSYSLPLILSAGSLHRGTRALGCLALALAWVAAGELAGLVARGKVWDIAAGVLLIDEAGGRTSKLDGCPRGLFDRAPTLFSNGACHQEVLGLLSTPVALP